MASDSEPALTIPVPERAQRHDLYYLETVVFRVENTLFRVPRRGFELESVLFASMFSLPAGKHNPEGQDDDSPIVPMGPNPPNLTHEDLVAVLHLSTMWELVKIRKAVIEIMEKKPMGTVEKILLAKKERISAWLRNGYIALVEANLLTIERVKLLDWETIAKLFAVQNQMPGGWRKRFDGHCTRCGCRYLANVAGKQLTPTECLVEEVFEQELRLIQEEEEEKWSDHLVEGDGDADMESESDSE